MPFNFDDYIDPKLRVPILSPLAWKDMILE